MAVDVEEALVILALANGNVAAIAGESVFPDRIPARSELPAVVFRRDSGGPILLVSGVSPVKRATIHVEAYSGNSQLEARQLSLAMQGLNGTRGVFGSWFVQLLKVVRDSESDEGIVPIHGDEKGAFRSSFDFDIGYNPSGA